MDNWQALLIGPDTPLTEAMQKLDDTAQRFLLVVDAQRHLLGSLTDGDIRRALLRHIPLHSTAGSIMNPNPHVFQPGDNPHQARQRCQRMGLDHLPRLNNKKQVCGLWPQSGLHAPCDNPVVLLAGGLGTRLRPLTEHCPKPMIPVGDSPLLELILQGFIEQGFHHFYLAVNYRAEMIEDHFGDGSKLGISIRYLREQQRLGTAGPLGLLPDMAQQPVLVMNADLLTRLDYHALLAHHQSQQAAATVCVRDYEHTVPFGVVSIQHGAIQSITEKPVQRSQVSAGIYVLAPEVLQDIPPHTPLDMPDLLQKLLQQKHTLASFPLTEAWIDIGRMDDLEKARALLADGL